MPYDHRSSILISLVILICTRVEGIPTVLSLIGVTEIIRASKREAPLEPIFTAELLKLGVLYKYM